MNNNGRDQETLKKESEEMLENEEELTEEEEDKIEEIAAKSRQYFDPEIKLFDYRKKRVTDIKRHSRVILPKPASPIDEAKIELRREIHKGVFREILENHCKTS